MVSLTSEEYPDVRGLMGTYIEKPNRARDTQWVTVVVIRRQTVSEKRKHGMHSDRATAAEKEKIVTAALISLSLFPERRRWPPRCPPLSHYTALKKRRGYYYKIIVTWLNFNSSCSHPFKLK